VLRFSFVFYGSRSRWNSASRSSCGTRVPFEIARTCIDIKMTETDVVFKRRSSPALGYCVTPSTLLEKVWGQHEIVRFKSGVSLLHIDRHLIHDLEAAPGLKRIAGRGYSVRRPDLTFATPDHAVASSPGRGTDTNPTGGRLLRDMRRLSALNGIRVFDIGEAGQGIVHVIGPELGLSQPGMAIVCGDSHTCTHGGLGALAFGIGSSEVAHVLATQTLRQKRPRTMQLYFEGRLRRGVTAKDLILFTIGQLGTAAGRGYAVEYAGPAISALSIEERLTICNMSIEMGAKIGMIAPDDTTFEYLAGRRYTPEGQLFERAVAFWRTLPSDQGAAFDAEHSFDAASIAPQVTWGTSPEDVIAVDGRIPDPAMEADPSRKQSLTNSLEYMGLEPGRPIAGTKVDWVFIGSCINSRLSDLRLAASYIRGRKVSPGIRAWVVPGSELVKRAAETEGLRTIFTDSGFEWREPSCSMCLAANGDRIAPGERSVSTSNRNFVGRQGPGARTHLASPTMAVAAALTGHITDPRRLDDTGTGTML
jgi:3-isopropylmalate/(R)-2-methylmalate dehydratase large subunit